MTLEQLTSTRIISFLFVSSVKFFSEVFNENWPFYVSGSKLNSNSNRTYNSVIWFDYRARQYIRSIQIDVIFMEWLCDSEMRVHGLNLNQINNHHSISCGIHINQFLWPIQNEIDGYECIGNLSAFRGLSIEFDRFIFQNIAALLSFYWLHWM